MSDTTSMETEPSLRYFRNLVCLPLLQGTKNVQKACRQTLVTRNRKLARSVPRQPNSMSAYMRQSLQTEHFQMLNVVFAFRSVFYDPLRELRLNALNLQLSVRLDAPGTQF